MVAAMMTLATRPVVRWGEVAHMITHGPRPGIRQRPVAWPGLVHVPRWRPDNPCDAEHAERIAAYGGAGHNL